jgi:tripartite-type tricarboxylate transporter receptor subunit TctC
MPFDTAMPSGTVSHPTLSRRRDVLSGLAAASAVALVAGRASGQAWPTRTIKLIAPFPPGGGTDVVSRLMADRMSALKGWSVAVENRTGAGGNIGLDAIAKAVPDGYTIGVGQTANMAINPALYPRMPFDPLTDLAPITLVAQQANILVVGANAPYRTVADLVAAAKARPGALTHGHPGNGTVSHLCGEMFNRQAGVRIEQIPFRGAAQVVTDLMGGRIDMYFGNPLAVLSFLQNGSLRALAVSSRDRIRVVPDVAPLAEQGFRDFHAVQWTGLVAPARTPGPIVAALHEAAVAALRTDEAVARLAAEGSDPIPGTPEAFAAFLRAEHASWGSLIREAGIKLE